MSTVLLRCPWTAMLAVGLALGWSTTLVGATAPPPPAIPTVLAAVPLQVLLRTADGTLVPGITVTLVPAAADAGGPPAGTNVQQGSTDVNGSVIFEQVQGAIWSARFQGIYQGQPLLPVAAQGQPPYGTTRGGGLVVQTALQEENAAPAPVVGQPAPAVETLAFVLLPTGTVWTPAIDLAGSTAPPQPLGRAATEAVPFLPTPAAGAVAVRTSNHGGDLARAWWLLPLGAAGGALWLAWRQRNREQRPTLRATHERGATAADAERSHHV